MRKIILYFILVLLQAACNYYTFAFSSAIGNSLKPNVIILKLLGIVNYIFWLPLGLLGHTKYGMILEWNYPAMIFVNSFLAVGIIYFVVFYLKNKF